MYEGFDTVGAFLLHIPSLKGQLLIPFFWFVLYWFSGYYNKPFGKSRLTELFSTLGSVSIGVVILFFALVLNDLPRSYHVYYDMFFSLWGLQFVLTYIPRLLITQAGLRKIKCREWALNVLMIGAGKKAACIADDLYGLGYNIVGFVSDGTEKKGGVAGDRVIGRLESLPVIVEEKKVDELVVALETVDNNRLMDILYSLYCYKRPIKILADKSSSLSQVKIKAIKGVPLVDVTDNNFLPIEQNVKLFMDKTLSLIFLVLLSPLFLYIAWRVKRDSPGPVFFSQERIGYMGEPFMIYKFRTMYTNAEEEGPLLSSEDDSRITPFGRVMRKYRLDELPQFWNVLKGDMSLVGTRPPTLDEWEKYELHHRARLAIKPGITGMWQVSGRSEITDFEEVVRLDTNYITEWSVGDGFQDPFQDSAGGGEKKKGRCDGEKRKGSMQENRIQHIFLVGGKVIRCIWRLRDFH